MEGRVSEIEVGVKMECRGGKRERGGGGLVEVESGIWIRMWRIGGRV